MRAVYLAGVMILSILVGAAISSHVQPGGSLASNGYTKETTKEIVVHSSAKESAPSIATAPSAAENNPPLVVPAATTEKVEVLALGEANTISLRGEVSSESMAQLQRELLKKSGELPDDATIYLTLDTPGGDIDAGNQFIDTAKAIPQKVKTLSIFSASMGFQIAQNLGERLITPSGTLMSHRARTSGMGGQVDGELETRVNFLKRMIDSMDLVASTRMGLSLPVYKNKVLNEYWVRGADAVAEKAADKVMLARCGKDMMGTYSEDINVLFFVAQVTFSKCPLITGPLSIEIKRHVTGGVPNDKQLEEAREYLNQMFFHKEEFVRDYIIPGKSKLTVK